jgi:hypothetical protein
VRVLKIKSIKYFLINQVLYWKYLLGVLLICLDPQEAHTIMSSFHDSLCGGIIFGGPQHIRFSGMDTSGLVYSPMFVLISEPMSSVINSLESSSLSLCH